MVKLFGESPEDFRDFRVGLAGLTASIHSLRILAEKGIADAADIEVAQKGIMDVLGQIPDADFSASHKVAIADMLEKVRMAAVAAAAK